MIKMKSTLKMFSVSTGVGVLVVGFQNCAGSGFEAIDPTEKVALLSSTTVLASASLDKNIGGVIQVSGGRGSKDGVIPVTGSGSASASGGSKGGTIPVAGSGSASASGGSKGGTIPVAGSGSASASGGSKGNSIPVSTSGQSTVKSATARIPILTSSVDPGKVDVSYFCSTMVGDKNTSLLQAKKVYYRVVLNQSVVYEPKADILKDILDKKSFHIPAEYFTGAYLIEVYDGDSGKSLITTISTGKASGFQISLYYDGNKGLVNSIGRAAISDNSKCNQTVSPLVVSLGNDVKTIDLSAPTEGIWFDILGKRSDPVPHTKKRISWFKNTPGSYYFVTLPNRFGEVQGIDQLFGDNTMGPDRRFAANGYAALAKYDDNKDNMITKDDKIFRELRLWRDDNLDGVGTRDELHSLDEMQVVSIDLDYDDKYYEQDIYGNETRMKSAVKTSDGNLHLIFDLWFRYLDR